MANIKDVAKKAGVSISTVSRVLNGTKKVSPDLYEKVMAAVNELDYSANIFAKGLKGSQSGIIAVVLTAISRTFFTSVLEGIHDVAEAKGYSVLITETYDDCEREKHLVTDLAAQWVDGIIIASSANRTDEETQSYIKNLHLLSKKETAIPVVSLEFPVDNPHVDAIVVNAEQAAYDAVSLLIEEYDRKNIVFVSIPKTHYLGKKRMKGFVRAMKEHDLPVNKETIEEGNYDPFSGFQAMERIIESGRKVDGIFCANDEMAIGVLKSCEKHGIRVPEDIAIIGNDDIFAATIVSPALSSIHVPKKAMGRAATTKLLQRIEEGVIPEERDIVTLDYKIVERQSTLGNKAQSSVYL